MNDACRAALSKTGVALYAVQSANSAETPDEEFMQLVYDCTQQICPMLEDSACSTVLAHKYLDYLQFYVYKRKERCSAVSSAADFKVLAFAALDYLIGALATKCTEYEVQLKKDEYQMTDAYVQVQAGNDVRNSAYDGISRPYGLAVEPYPISETPLFDANALIANSYFDYIFGGWTSSKQPTEQVQLPYREYQPIYSIPALKYTFSVSDSRTAATAEKLDGLQASDLQAKSTHISKDVLFQVESVETASYTDVETENRLHSLAEEVRQQMLACGAAQNIAMHHCQAEFCYFGYFMVEELSKVARAIYNCYFAQNVLYRETRQFQRITTAECSKIYYETRIVKNVLAGSMRCAQAQIYTLGCAMQRFMQISASQRENCGAVAVKVGESERSLVKKANSLLNQARFAFFCLQKQSRQSGELMRRMCCRQRELFECLPSTSLLGKAIAVSRAAAFLIKGDNALDEAAYRCESALTAAKDFYNRSAALDCYSLAIVESAIKGAESKASRLAASSRQCVAVLRKQLDESTLVVSNRELRIQLLQAQTQAEEADELKRYAAELKDGQADARAYATSLEAELAQMRYKIDGLLVYHECMSGQLAGLYPTLFASPSDYIVQIERRVQLCADFEDALRIRSECAIYAMICENDYRFLRKAESRLALARKVQNKLTRENQRLAEELERYGYDERRSRTTAELR